MIFQEKYFCYILLTKLTDFIVWLPLLLEIPGNTYIVIVYFLICDVINLIINPIFLIKPFSYMTKKLEQNLKCLKKEKSFYSKINFS